MTEKAFLHQIKHNKTNDTWDKGIVVKDNLDGALQAYHAYLGAYAYGHDENTDFVSCMISTSAFGILNQYVETWREEPAPEPEEQEE